MEPHSNGQILILVQQKVESKAHFSTAHYYKYETNQHDINFAYHISFLQPILSVIQRVNKAFEPNESEPPKLLEDLSIWSNSS